ncbi:oxidative damage protection protein [candidate division KSB1 bacterium]|nr:oxidative damage protection protein [candidate division KSB1 bacterium]NIR68659.1 oxidative damage protection protein [candidate division KSB1 bacterium]NIS27148.1 oxidative damage protection protein [candidate division KSB1 bacterium]NIT74034.1 oxidative damage protection protein [candidate division KSB1 bacterium]NIU27900.1 oxidative damage protection protein [candidate division KSB1 bacterium]
MAKVTCLRCGNEKEGLDEAPFRNELGKRILEHTCNDCWDEWMGQQLMFMNEYRLDPLNDEHSKYLDEEMVKFLNLK